MFAREASQAIGFAAEHERDVAFQVDRIQRPLGLAREAVDPHALLLQVNATVRKTSAGAADSIPVVRVTNLARCLRDLQQQGVWIYGLAGEADASLYSIDLKGNVALVLGGEADGLRRLTREHCDQLVRIPMPGEFESLNVSVATGVALFEAVRQRIA